MGGPAVPAVVDWVEHERMKDAPNIGVVGLAARLLGLIGSTEAEPTLLALLQSAVPDWRIAAASALEHAGTEVAVEPLRVALHDDDWRVRARAVVALGASADPTVLDEVAQLLTDGQWWVRQNAATALSKLPGGNDRLQACLDSPDPYAADAALNQLTASGAFRRPIPTGT
jgi:HEAT repeat protein